MASLWESGSEEDATATDGAQASSGQGASARVFMGAAPAQEAALDRQERVRDDVSYQMR